MKLEARVRTPRLAEDGWTIESGVLSLFPLLARLAVDPVDGAELFHGTFAAACIDWIARAALETSVTTVILSGGCFLNAILADEIGRGCVAAGLSPLLPRQVPSNDGGLSLGQAWVAALQLLEQQGPEGNA